MKVLKIVRNIWAFMQAVGVVLDFVRTEWPALRAELGDVKREMREALAVLKELRDKAPPIPRLPTS